MASPLSYFRKHAHILMVALVVLSLFAFTMADSLMSADGANYPLLGMMFGGFLLTAYGYWATTDATHSIKLGIVGAAVGAGAFWLAFEGTGSIAAGGGVQTAAGFYSDSDIDQLVNKRNTANQFLQMIGSRRNFTVGYSMDIQRDVVVGDLLRQKADELGVAVSDNAISQFLKSESGNTLTKDMFMKALSRFHVNNKRMTEDELYNIIRDEMKSSMALRLVRPFRHEQDPPPTPDVFWDLYKRLNVTQELVTTAVPVEAFTEKVAEPSDSEIAALFEKNKTLFPNEQRPGSAGFRQPRKIAVAYLEADYATIESGIAAISDDEVKAFYEKNKDRDYTNDFLPNSFEGGEVPDDPGLPPIIPGPQSNNPLFPTDPPPTPDGDAEEVGEEKADDSPEADASEEAESTDSGDESSEEGDGCGFFPQEEGEESSEQKPEKPANAKPAAEKPAKPKPAAESKPETKQPAQEPKPETAKPETKAPASQEKPADKPAEKPVETKPAGSKPAAAEKSESPDKQPEKPAEKPSDDKAATDGKPAGEVKADDPPPKYRPLDAALMEEIRDRILREKGMDEVINRMNSAVAEMRRLDDVHRFQKFKAGEEPSNAEVGKIMSTELRKFADKNGLQYVETGMLSYKEMNDFEENPIGGAIEPMSDAVQGTPRTVADRLFTSREPAVFSAEQAVDQLTNNRFAFWVVDHGNSYVPKLDEPGIREQVVAALKLEAARPLAKKRADELAAMAEKAIKDGKQMADGLADQTTTGDDSGSKLTSRESMRISWMRQSAASPQTSFMPGPPEVTDVAGLEDAGDKFMQVVFEEMDNDQVAVVLNDSESIYYIVQVRGREPEAGEKLDEMRQKFMTSNPFGWMSPLPLLIRGEQLRLNTEWTKKLEETYGLDWTSFEAARDAG